MHSASCIDAVKARLLTTLKLNMIDHRLLGSYSLKTDM